MSTKIITSKDKWLLTLIGSTPYVKGKTRLQKYGILVHKEIFDNSEFFDDWQSYKYGMYSQQLTNSLEKLENNGYIVAYDTFNFDNKPVKNYKLTDIGMALKNEWVEDKKDRFTRIAHITSAYFHKSLKELLSDTYQKFPEFTNKSTIGAKVRKDRTDDMPFLNSEFNLHHKEKNDPAKLSIPIKEHVFNDDDFRLKLAKSVGYDKIPHLNPKSFDELKGLFADKFESKYIDTVELIKESRGY